MAVRSKHLMTNTSPSKESAQMPLLNANAAAVLSELGLSEEDSSHPAPKSTLKPTKRPSVGATKPFNPGKANMDDHFVCIMCTYST